MNFKDFYKMSLDNFLQRMDLSAKKSHDYATDDDTLHNFKAQGKLTGMKPSQCAAQLVMVKAVRLGNLIFGDKTPANESVEDTIFDMQNYLDLMLACMYEECTHLFDGADNGDDDSDVQAMTVSEVMSYWENRVGKHEVLPDSVRRTLKFTGAKDATD
jgi:hypothetical protein